MAINDLTMNFARWKAVLADCDAAEAAAAAIKDHPQCSVRDVVAIAAETVDQVYLVPASTLGGLRRKLELLWATELWDETYGTDFRHTMIGDLVRLEMLLAGVDPEEASGGMDLDKVGTDFSDAASEYDHCVHLHHGGPSEAYGASSSSDLAAIVDEAETKLLSLSSPNLGGVEKKLTILFGDNSFSRIDNSAVHALILRDLRRFITHQQ